MQSTTPQELVQSLLSSVNVLDNYEPSAPSPNGSSPNETNGFIKITDDEMPEILKFLQDNKDYDFKEWAVVGQADARQHETQPQSSQSNISSNESQPVNPDEEGDGGGGDGHLGNSMFLRNFEEELRLAREERAKAWSAAGQQNQQQQNQEFPKPEPSLTHLIPSQCAPLVNVPDACCSQPNACEKEALLRDLDADSLGESWVWIEKPSADTCAHPLLLEQPPFFANWPSFGVYNKLKAVGAATVGAFTFGFVIGAQAAMDSFYRLCERPAVAGGLGMALSFAVSLQPTIILTAVRYVVIGGVVGGTAMATPVFVVGTTGVFVTAAVYHSFVAAKRGTQRALGMQQT